MYGSYCYTVVVVTLPSLLFVGLFVIHFCSVAADQSCITLLGGGKKYSKPLCSIVLFCCCVVITFVSGKIFTRSQMY